MGHGTADSAKCVTSSIKECFKLGRIDFSMADTFNAREWAVDC
jgi:hypothetical protein